MSRIFTYSAELHGDIRKIQKKMTPQSFTCWPSWFAIAYNLGAKEYALAGIVAVVQCVLYLVVRHYASKVSDETHVKVAELTVQLNPDKFLEAFDEETHSSDNDVDSLIGVSEGGSLYVAVNESIRAIVDEAVVIQVNGVPVRLGDTMVEVVS